MLKKVIVAALAMMLVPTLCFATCGLWELGYKGKAESCVMNIKLPVPGVPVKLVAAPGGQSTNKTTDAAGKYCISLKFNNCKTNVGFFTQAVAVSLDMTSIGYPIKKTCSFSDDYPCCCDLCTIKVIKCCDILYRFCCTII
jgi:hypothetical protein